MEHSPYLLMAQRQAEARRQARMVARIAMEAGERVPGVVAGTGADPLRLRGIPAIGRNVSGAIRGTDPERAVVR